MAKFDEYERVGKQYNIGGDWFKLKSGDNKIRILTELHEYAKHFVKSENKSYTCEGEWCELCFKGDKKKLEFIGFIMDRADGQIKPASLGWSIFKQIGKLATSEEWRFDGTPPYDILIKRTGEGLGTEYTVMPTRNETPLTVEQEQKVRELKDPSEIVTKLKEKHPGRRLEKPIKKSLDEDDIPIIGGKAEDDFPDDEKISPDDLPF